jgi:cobalt-zinc-cadmium efflux system protein
MTSDDISASAHVQLEPGANAEEVRLAAAAMLHDRFEIQHVTVQVEEVACEDAPHIHR